MANWIWIDKKADIHQFVRFRKKINIAKNGTYKFRISAETNFTAFCDGKEFLRGQYSDFPWHKTYTGYDLELLAGEHLIAIEVYYCGEDFLTSWSSGQPALYCEIDGICQSDTTWKCQFANAYLRDRIDKITVQLGFVVTYDAAADEDFASPDFDDSHWQNAVKVEKNVKLSPRPVPSMLRSDYIDGKIVNQGFFQRELPENKDISYALTVENDTYDTNSGNGFYKIFDVGCERSGLIVLECDALRSGICIDISHGEHINNSNRVHNRVVTRNYTDRYFTGEGHQRFILHRRAGCRYIQLNILAKEEDFKFIKCGMEEENLPLPETADFQCDDAVTMKMRENSIRTLRCCMHEHYEDCPLREQSLYAYDSRNQIMFGYYLWGNYEYAAQNWHLLAEGVKDDGFLYLTAPSKYGPPISNFSVVFVTAMLEHYMYYGEKTLFDSLKNTADGIVKVCTEHIDEKSGLFMTSHIEGMWHFYEWRPGLQGECKNEPPYGKEDCLPKLESVYNLYLIEMFKALHELTGEEKYLELAESQRAALFNTFYDRQKKCMITRFGDDRLHGIVQVLAIIHKVVPEEDVDQLLERVYNGEFISVSISSMRYYLELLMSRGGKFREMADALINDTFSVMLKNNSTTMWETDKGAEDFNGAGSMCHGWSALPIYYYYRYLLGVAPSEPGFKKFSVDIYPMAKYGDISGEVVTPHGKIQIAYDRNCESLTVSAPCGTEAVISDNTKQTFKNIILK